MVAGSSILAFERSGRWWAHVAAWAFVALVGITNLNVPDAPIMALDTVLTSCLGAVAIGILVRMMLVHVAIQGDQVVLGRGRRQIVLAREDILDVVPGSVHNEWVVDAPQGLVVVPLQWVRRAPRSEIRSWLHESSAGAPTVRAIDVSSRRAGLAVMAFGALALNHLLWAPDLRNDPTGFALIALGELALLQGMVVQHLLRSGASIEGDSLALWRWGRTRRFDLRTVTQVSVEAPTRIQPTLLFMVAWLMPVLPTAIALLWLKPAITVDVDGRRYIVSAWLVRPGASYSFARVLASRITPIGAVEGLDTRPTPRIGFSMPRRKRREMLAASVLLAVFLAALAVARPGSITSLVVAVLYAMALGVFLLVLVDPGAPRCVEGGIRLRGQPFGTKTSSRPRKWSVAAWCSW